LTKLRFQDSPHVPLPPQFSHHHRGALSSPGSHGHSLTVASASTASAVESVRRYQPLMPLSAGAYTLPSRIVMRGGTMARFT